MAKLIWISDIQDGTYDNSEVEIKGWIHRFRGSNKIWFMVVRDSTGIIQCVIKKEIVGEKNFNLLKSSLTESSVIIKGHVLQTEREHGRELQVTSGEIIGGVSPDNPYPITESAMDEAEGGETEFL